jgi:hypothetical protein
LDGSAGDIFGSPLRGSLKCLLSKSNSRTTSIVQRSSSNSIALATGQNCPYDDMTRSPSDARPVRDSTDLEPQFTARRDVLAVGHFPAGAVLRDYFKTNYGPTITAYRNIEGDAERVAALDRALAELGDRYLAGSSTMPWEYLLVTARKR